MKKNPSIISLFSNFIDPDQTMFTTEYVAKPFDAGLAEVLLTLAQTIAQGFSNPSETLLKDDLDNISKTLQDKTNSKFGFLTRVDRFLMGIRKNANGDPVIYSGGRTRPLVKEET